MHHSSFRSAFLLLAALAFARSATAEDACEAPSPECATVGQWDLSISLGAGTRTNPIEHNGDIPLVLIPQISYYGKRFFLENLELGFALHEGRQHTFNLIATPGYDRVFFYRNDPQNIFIPFGQGPVGGQGGNPQVNVPRPHATALVGPEWMFYRGKLVGQLDALYEVTGEHEGYEVRAAISLPLLESRGELTASTGFTWKSTELVNYYYGIEGVYQADSAFNPFVKLVYSLPVSERWTFNAFAHYEHLDPDVADSPLIADPGVTTVFVGFVRKIF